MFRKKRPYRRIMGVIGSCLCSVLWWYLTVLFTVTGRGFVFPLIAAVIFSACAVAEAVNYRKYGNAAASAKPGKTEDKDSGQEKR